MLTIEQWADRVGISRQWASRLAKDGRIAGLRVVGGKYMVPEGAGKPVDRKPGRAASPTSTRALRAARKAANALLKVERERKAVADKAERERVRDVEHAWNDRHKGVI